MTDGMAIRELMIGKMFDVFVIDEAHERSINTDVLMALLKDKIKNAARTNEKHKSNRQRNFKIIIMSATI
jgi:HrpA-like RNA helicase